MTFYDNGFMLFTRKLNLHSIDATINAMTIEIKKHNKATSKIILGKAKREKH